MNEQERQQQERARQMKSFAAAFGRGQANAVDRFGQIIKDGDKLMLKFQVDPIVDVMAVNPVLDPKAPAGLIDVMCTVTFPLRVQAGQPFQFANIVARRQETAVSDNGQGPKLALVDTQPSDPPEEMDPPDEDGPLVG